jgi:hypothetical protein
MAMTTSSSIRVKALRRTMVRTGGGVMAALGILNFMEALAGVADKGQVRIWFEYAPLSLGRDSGRFRSGN